MAGSRDRGVRDAAEAALDAEGELAVAERVYGVYELYYKSGLTHAQRIQRVAAQVEMPAQRVRRYLFLHTAPADIKQLYLEGQLSGRMVEALQGVKPENQRILARMVMGKARSPSSVTAMGYTVDRSAPKTWTEEAREFERKLEASLAMLNPYFDAPRGHLTKTFEGVGSALGRRAIVSLIETQISLLGTLRDLLERVDGVAEGGKPMHAATTAADSS